MIIYLIILYNIISTYRLGDQNLTLPVWIFSQHSTKREASRTCKNVQKQTKEDKKEDEETAGVDREATAAAAGVRYGTRQGMWQGVWFGCVRCGWYTIVFGHGAIEFVVDSIWCDHFENETIGCSSVKIQLLSYF